MPQRRKPAFHTLTIDDPDPDCAAGTPELEGLGFTKTSDSDFLGTGFVLRGVD
jgi:hypothetical protein